MKQQTKADKPPTRTEQRRTRRAVEVLSTGASAREVAQLLGVRTSTAERLKRALGNNTAKGGSTMTEHIDLSDERLVPTRMAGGEPALLRPEDDGSITVLRRSDLAIPPGSWGSSVDLSDLQTQFDELTGIRPDVGSEAEAEPSEDEMVAAFEAFRSGGRSSERSGEQTTAEDGAEFSEAVDFSDDIVVAAETNPYTDEQLIDAWKAYAKEQGINLPGGFSVDLSLQVGDAVEWGQGQGKGHGILMELDTSEGNALVHTAEVITHQMGGLQLSPTGKTIKIDAGKLRASDLPLVGEVPIGPELSGGGPGTADLSDDDSDETLWAKIQRQMRRMGGGFGGE